MPHIDIKAFPRELTEQQKSDLAAEMTQLMQKYLQSREGSVSVALSFVPQEQWKTSVWETEIAPQLETLIKQPDYRMS